MTTGTLWTLPLWAAAVLAALRGASGLPAPAYISTGVSVGDDMPALAYAGAGTLRDGMYTTVYDNYGEAFHSFWPFDRRWNAADLPPWRSANAFRTSWKPAITRREIPTHMTPIDLRMGHRCAWEIRPGHSSVSVPVGVACSSAHEPQENARHALPTSHRHAASKDPAVPESAESAFSSSLPSQLGDAAQLVMQQTEGEAADEQADDLVPGGNLLDVRSAADAPAGHSRRRRQVSRVGGRGASAAAAAASASSGPWGSSASAAAASAASGGRRRPSYGYRPAYYGRWPAYGRPYPGAYYG